MTAFLSSASPTLSIIIPCWNDADVLDAQLTALTALRGIDEIIVADASHGADCAKIALSHGARLVICPQANRGSQLNEGASIARGSVLLFHHADSELGQEHVDALRRGMGSEKFVGGGFYRKFDQRHPHLGWLERWGRRLNDLGGTIYGDQSIFVRHDAFEELGGFAPIPLMEDIEFSRRLHRYGRVVLLDPPIRTSARRFVRRGAWRSTMENGTLILLYKLGVSPWRLHGWYYRQHVANRAAT